MRYAYLIPVALLIPLTGCAALIHASGTRLEDLKTKDEVHQKFGEPIRAGIENGHPYEEYHTHRKISEYMTGEGYLILDVVTLGLAELYLLPYELIRVTRSTVTGQTVRFTYDEDGNVKSPWFEGGPWLHPAPETGENRGRP